MKLSPPSANDTIGTRDPSMTRSGILPPTTLKETTLPTRHDNVKADLEYIAVQ